MSIDAIPAAVRAGLEKLSQAQTDMLAAAPAEMRGFLESQIKMQKEQQLSQLIGTLMKSDKEQSTQILRALGG